MNAGDRSISRRERKKKIAIETSSHLRNDRSKLTKIRQESSVDAKNYTRGVIEDEWNDSGFSSVYDLSNDDGNGKEEERDNPSVTTATVRGMDGTGVNNGSLNTASIAGHTTAEPEDEITKRTATFMSNEEEMKESLLRKKLLDKKKQRQRGGNGDGDCKSAAAGGVGEVRDEFGRGLPTTTTTTHCKNTESASSSSRRYDFTMINPRAVLLRRTNESNHSPSWAPPDEARTGCGGTDSDFSVFDPPNKDVDENDQSPNNNNIGDGLEVTNPTNDTDKGHSTEAPSKYNDTAGVVAQEDDNGDKASVNNSEMQPPDDASLGPIELTEYQVRQFTPDERKIVAQAIYGIGPSDEILAKHKNDTVQRGSMRTLAPGIWLNDEIINYFVKNCLAVLDEKLRTEQPTRRQSHCYNSYFIQNLFDTKASNEKLRWKYNYNNVRRWSQNVPGEDIFNLEYILCPINTDNKHWSCAVISVQGKKIQYYDSLGRTGRVILSGLLQYVADEYLMKHERKMDVSGWEMVDCTKDTPRQRNDFDCGVYTCMFCYCILKDIPLVFDQSYIDLCRERICLSIMKNIAIGFDNDVVSVVALKDSTNNEVDQENIPPTVNNPPCNGKQIAKPLQIQGNDKEEEEEKKRDTNHRDNSFTSMTKTATAKGMVGASIAGHNMAELEDETTTMHTATTQHSVPEIDALKKELSEVSMQISSLKIDLSSAVSEKDILVTQVESITSERDFLMSRLMQAKNHVSRAEKERDEMVSQMNSLQGFVAEQQSTIDTLGRYGNEEVKKVLSLLHFERDVFASSLHQTKEDASRFERARDEAIVQLHGSQYSVAELKGEVDRLVAEVDSSKTENGALLSQVEAVASELKQCLCDLERVTAEKDALATKLANVEADSKVDGAILSSMKSEKDLLMSRLMQAKEDVSRAEKERDEMVSQMNSLQGSVAEQQSTIDTLKRSGNEEFNKVLSLLHSEREMFASSLHQTKEDASRFERERNEAIVQLHGSQYSVAELKGEVDRLVAEVDSSKTENGALLSQVEAVASELKQCLCDLERVTAEKDALATELANVEADSKVDDAILSSMKSEKDLLMSRLMQAKEDVSRAEKERDEIVSQMNSLQGSVAELTSETDRLRAERDASNNEKNALLSQLETMTVQGDSVVSEYKQSMPEPERIVSIAGHNDVGIRQDNNEGSGRRRGGGRKKGANPSNDDGNDKDKLPDNDNAGDGVEVMRTTNTTNYIGDKEEEMRGTNLTNDTGKDHSTKSSKCRDTVGAVGESNPELECILPATNVAIDLPITAAASNVTSVASCNSVIGTTRSSTAFATVARRNIHWPNNLDPVCLFNTSEEPCMVRVVSTVNQHAPTILRPSTMRPIVGALKDSTNKTVNQKNIPPTVSNPPSVKPIISSCSNHYFKFITSKKMVHADSMSWSLKYMRYLDTLGLSHKVCQEACRVQGLTKSANGNQWKTRLDMNSEEEIMNNVPNFCKDESVNGLPMRTIFTIGPSYDIIYEFVISIKKSNCCTDSGNGAFLTFKGAKMLKKGSKWKRAGYLKAAETRATLEAYISDSRYTVTLTGRDIHDDNRVDFVAEDFIDAEDNITFSSKHIECGLVELESRYGPLLPTDRKTDLIFTVKDFLFSHEPSSWRFDVKETLNIEKFEPDASRTDYNSISQSSRTQATVIDFTDDATGAPHEVAQSHVSMYVNEVGHDASLVENIAALSSRDGSVIYYINIDEPLSKGGTVELLTNYSDTYETMRVRRGYGNDNLVKGVKGDDYDIARVQRNVQERFEIEGTIKKYVLPDLVDVVHFLQDRVWDSLKAATSKFDKGCSQTDLNLTRQCIARRRIDWIMRLLSNRLKSLLGNRTVEQYQEGNLVFVNVWPQNGARSPYTGLAVINSIAKDEHNRETFNVTTSDNKCISHVPEGVVTFPTEDDMKNASKRERRKYELWKMEQAIPRIVDCLASFKWDATFARSIKASSPTSPCVSTILNSLRWEFVEEILFVLVKNNRVPLQFVATHLCPTSASFVLESLLLIAEFLLVGNADLGELFQSLMKLGRVASNTVKATIERIRMPADKATVSLVSQLCFETGLSEAQRQLVVEPNNEVSLDHFLNNPMRLDYNWYAIHQIALPLHKIASVLDWGNLYSVENLCDELSLELSPYDRSKLFKDWEPLL